MPVKIISTQIRPNTTVDWYTPEKLDPSLRDQSMGSNANLVEEPVVEISQDGLTYTKTFIFSDDFEPVIRLDKTYLEAVENYVTENNIELFYTTEAV